MISLTMQIPVVFTDDQFGTLWYISFKIYQYICTWVYNNFYT